ncbi:MULTISPECIES: chaperone modulator CbpM [unclassified Microcoleus]|uniref:chaperone modulator CbpM n=1 Tax=unclassified Microcoleus TaxID=2642155 RepID=UPI002FD09895
MTEFSLSTMVVSENGDRLYTFEYAALVTETSTMIIEQFVQVGLIEPIGSMLHAREISRIGQIQRLRQDLGLNLVGAVMVVDMAQEIAQLRARLKALQS